MVNRNQGAGTRILIDRLLKGARPEGYFNQPRSHNAVAAAVAQGRADWGLAIAQAAQAYDLGFIPLAQEHYDFALVTRARGQACGAGVPAIAGVGGDEGGAAAAGVRTGVGGVRGNSLSTVMVGEGRPSTTGHSAHELRPGTRGWPRLALQAWLLVDGLPSQTMTYAGSWRA